MQYKQNKRFGMSSKLNDVVKFSEVGLQLLAISSCFVLSDLSESKIVLKESRQIVGESDIGNSTVQQS
ncbi:hypothetical protein QYM36_011388 [Artemia franciscana]|uniref:Uncharacterized protein n=1 Tax=Artemia franciscana TaxID=6661 RepID=A0AA88HPE9_ARTSF|nr:hypothetical protein QYM36_011388 [Artemia franciscana]